MKRILLLILVLFSFAASAQTDDSSRYTRYKYKYGDKVSRIMADSIFHLPFHDTTFTPNRPGALTFRPQDSLLYQWNGLLWSLLTSSGAGGQTIDEVLTEGNESDIAARLGGLDFLPNGYFRFPARGSDDPLSTPEGTVYYDSIGNNFRGQQGTIFYNFLTSAIVSADSAMGFSNVMLSTQRAITQHIQNRLDDYLLLSNLQDSLAHYGWQVKYPLQVLDGGDNQDTVTINTDAWNGIALKQWVRDTLTGFSGYTDEQAQDVIATMIQNGTGISWSYNDVSGTLTPTVSLASFSTTNLAEGTNLYYTDARARASISLTTTGTSGAATYNSSTGVLNIPQYSGGGSSYTFTNAITESGGTVKLGGALTEATTITNTNTFTFSLLNNTDAASVQVAKLEGDRATMADNDEAYLSLMLSNDAGTQTEFGRFSWVATDVNAGTSVDGRINIGVTVAGTLASEWSIDGTALFPFTDGGADIGKSTLGVNNIHINTGGDVTWENGDVRISHASNQMYFIGAASNYIFDGTIRLSTSASADLGSGTFQWNNLYVSSSVNFSNGDVTITRTSNLLTVAGGDFAVPDAAYGAGWNGSVKVPTQNAIYDQIELIHVALLDSLSDHHLRLVALEAAGGGGASTWGSITGTLSDQTDLQTALNAKVGSFTDGSGFDGTIAAGVLSITTTLTQGSIPFIGASGALSQDNAAFFWDATNDRIGLGTSTPSYSVHLYQNTATTTSTGLFIENAGLGDVNVRFKRGASAIFTMGIDQSTSDRFVISVGSTLGTTNAMTIASDASIALGNTSPIAKVTIPAGSGAAFGAPLAFAGTAALMATPQVGRFEYPDQLYFTTSDGVRHQITGAALLGASSNTFTGQIEIGGAVIMTGLTTNFADNMIFQTSSGNIVKGEFGNGVEISTGNVFSTKSYSLTTITTDAGNVGSGEDDLHSYPVDADELGQNGDYIEAEFFFNYAVNANSKTLKIYWAGSSVTTYSGVTSAGGYVRVKVKIIRTGATTQEITIEIDPLNGTRTYLTTTGSATLSSSNILKCTGEAVADNDIVQQNSVIRKWRN